MSKLEGAENQMQGSNWFAQALDQSMLRRRRDRNEGQQGTSVPSSAPPTSTGQGQAGETVGQGQERSPQQTPGVGPTSGPPEGPLGAGQRPPGLGSWGSIPPPPPGPPPTFLEAKGCGKGSWDWGTSWPSSSVPGSGSGQVPGVGVPPGVFPQAFAQGKGGVASGVNVGASGVGVGQADFVGQSVGTGPWNPFWSQQNTPYGCAGAAAAVPQVQTSHLDLILMMQQQLQQQGAVLATLVDKLASQGSTPSQPSVVEQRPRGAQGESTGSSQQQSGGSGGSIGGDKSFKHVDAKLIPAMPVCSPEKWHSRPQQILGFSQYMESLSAWLSTLAPTYTREIEEAMTSTDQYEPSTDVAVQEEKSSFVFHSQTSFCSKPKIAE